MSPFRGQFGSGRAYEQDIEAAQRSRRVGSERSAILGVGQQGREHLTASSWACIAAEASICRNYSDVKSLTKAAAYRKRQSTTAQLMFDAAANIGSAAAAGSKLASAPEVGSVSVTPPAWRAYDDIAQNMNSEQAAQINACKSIRT
jgi:hypothetical protein